MFPKIAFCMITLTYLGFFSENPNDIRVENTEFVVNYEPHSGFTFESKSEQFIVPEFANESDADALRQIWQQAEDGQYSPGNELFCECRGAYSIRNGRKSFQVIGAIFFGTGRHAGRI